MALQDLSHVHTHIIRRRCRRCSITIAIHVFQPSDGDGVSDFMLLAGKKTTAHSSTVLTSLNNNYMSALRYELQSMPVLVHCTALCDHLTKRDKETHSHRNKKNKTKLQLQKTVILRRAFDALDLDGPILGLGRRNNGSFLIISILLFIMWPNGSRDSTDIIDADMCAAVRTRATIVSDYQFFGLSVQLRNFFFFLCFRKE